MFDTVFYFRPFGIVKPIQCPYEITCNPADTLKAYAFSHHAVIFRHHMRHWHCQCYLWFHHGCFGIVHGYHTFLPDKSPIKFYFGVPLPPIPLRMIPSGKVTGCPFQRNFKYMNLGFHYDHVLHKDRRNNRS